MLCPRRRSNSSRIVSKSKARRCLQPTASLKTKYCQAEFNTAIGLDPSIDWREAGKIIAQVNSYAESNATDLLMICAARAKFYQCLGKQYNSCVSLYSLIGKPQTSLQNAERLYYSLDFMCNAGFEETMHQYDCIATIALTGAVKPCFDTFNAQISGHPERLCDAVNTNGGCLNDLYANTCTTDPKGAGWYGCQSWVGAYEESCYTKPRCFVH